MAPSISWIDHNKFASLLRQLDAPSRPRRAPTPAPNGAPKIAAKTPRVSTASPVVARADFVAPDGPIELRAEALLKWIDHSFTCDAAFVADEHGLAVVERNAAAETLALSVALLPCIQEVQFILPGTPAHITLRLDNARVLSFLLVDSQWGQFGVGMVAKNALEIDMMNMLANAVKMTFANDGSQKE